MKALGRHSSVLIAGLILTANLAYGDQPPNVVTSDANQNTAMGTHALLDLTQGVYNTAAGYSALSLNTSGNVNSAFGANALTYNSTGSANSASGFNALAFNTTGNNNTATGYAALTANTSGNENTATGYAALISNTTGDNNTAAGSYALFSNTSGNSNTAAGWAALNFNTKGSDNTANGYQALSSNTTGKRNTAQGSGALFSNATGARNVAVGYSALNNNTTGRSNTAIGSFAGTWTTGDDNILVANSGVAGESQTMRLGKQGRDGVINSGVTRTFIAGVRGVTTGLAGAAVLVDSRGQLGTVSSSRRYKQDIQSMADASERLQQLRPVKFRYKQPDAAGEQPIQYGLIAEEVAEVFPELVLLNERGQPESVGYHLLSALLLNELQKEHQLNLQHSQQLALQQRQLEAQASQLAAVSALQQQLAEVKELLAALQPQDKEAQIAMR